MAKRSREKGENGLKISKENSHTASLFLAEREAVDPDLANLFASSAGPVKPPSRTRYDQASRLTRASAHVNAEESSDAESRPQDENHEELSSLNEDLEHASAASIEEIESSHSSQGLATTFSQTEKHDPAQNLLRKRKHGSTEDDLEGKYMLRIMKKDEREEEARQAKRRLKRQKLTVDRAPNLLDKEQDLEEGSDSLESDRLGAYKVKEGPSSGPQHETLAPDKDAIELEKSSRTVFLANVSTTAIIDKKAKKTLLSHMASFLDSLPVRDGEKKHKIESMRFRSTAYAGGGLPKKAAFTTKNLMGETTKSTHAYVVYSTDFAAREAVKKLNGTLILNRHLRVDSVAYPARTDHRRCVFVGNLCFVDNERMMDQGGENERKRSKIPSDVEEGLWRQFSKAGTVESVRVVRDEKTRVGKGFAYVQFQNANSVEAALLFHDKKYPPMLPRVLRVTRAKAAKKVATLAPKYTRPPYRSLPNDSSNAHQERMYNPKISRHHQSLRGRAAKLLGRAGAVQFKRAGGRGGSETQASKSLEGVIRTPEKIVFEGYRASQKSGKPKDLKFGGGRAGKRSNPQTRSRERASDWKKRGGKG